MAREATTKERDGGDTRGVLAIDGSNLHLEWQRQADIYHDAAVDLADIKLELDLAEAKLKVRENEVRNNVRRKPDKYGIVKLTEGAIDEVVAAYPKLAQMQEEILTLKHHAAMAKALVDSLDQKKKALEKLVDLILSDYWAEPKLKRGALKTLEEVMKSDTRRRGRPREKEKNDSE